MPSMRPIRSCSWAVKAALLGAVACASTSAASIAYAAESVATRTVRVDIAPKNLEAALIELSSQADVQLVMSADEVRGLSTTGLSGEYSLEEALQRLLSGSGLTYKIAPGGTVSVVKVETPQPSATPARSSSPERSEARNAPREIGLEEIIVTAQKRAESAQDVPITMQALSAEELRDRGVASAADVIAALPNLTSNATSDINVGFTIRGVGTNNYHGNVSRAVGIYQDEVSMSTPFSGVLGVYDVERVEVLRGPQNTLFGRNTTGGAINYISRQPRPGEGFDGYLEATYGRYAQRDMQGAIGFDLGSSVAARLSFQTINRDGLFHNLSTGDKKFGDKERHSGRAQLAWEPTDDTRVLLNYHIGLNRGESLGNKGNGLLNADGTLCSEIDLVGNFRRRNNCFDRGGFGTAPFNPSTDDWHHIYNVSSTRADVDIQGGFLRFEHDFSAATFVSITSYDVTDVQFADDASATNTFQFTPFQDSRYSQFTQELRLMSTGEGPLRAIGGLYYFTEDLEQATNVRRFVNNAGTTAFNILDQTDEDISIYGQLEYDLHPSLTITAGVRYTDNEKEADSLFGVAVTPFTTIPTNTFISREMVERLTENAPETCPPGPPGVDPVTGRPFGGPPPCRLPLLHPRQSTHEVGGKLGLAWRFTDDAMLYGHYSRGFKSGGFDTRALAAFSGNVETPVEPETLDAYEIGVKSELLDSTLRLNASAFYYEWSDLQTFATINSVPGFYNIPTAELRGLEVELNWVPADGWLVQGGMGYLQTEITDVGDLAGTIDEGHELPNSPELTFNALASKRILIGDGALTLQGDVRYIGKQVDSLQYALDRISTNEEQTYLNARISYAFGANHRYQISLFGENLTSEKTCVDIGPFDDPTVTPANPAALQTATNQCAPSDGTALFGITGRVTF